MVEIEHAGVEVGQGNAVAFVILGLQADDVGLDAQVDVLGDEDGGDFWLGLLDGEGEVEDAVVNSIAAEDGVGVVGRGRGR